MFIGAFAPKALENKNTFIAKAERNKGPNAGNRALHCYRG